MLLATPSLLTPASLKEIGRSTAQQNPAAPAENFGTLLKEKINELNTLQQRADALTQEYLAGRLDDVHQVMLAMEEANLSLQLAVQVRNKVVEAYQEISRMQF